MDAGLRLLIAALLDIIFGDPRFIPHPVRILGAYIKFCENRIRKIFPKHEFISGAITGISTVIIGYGMVFFSIKIAGMIGKYAAQIVEILWIYLAISAGDLDKSVMNVLNALKKGDIKSARKKLSLIVGRDTENLDSPEISRAAVETTAESLVDGIISPLFFLLLGGAPLMWAFKAASTCDSMIGYNDEKYKFFGRFSARFDDLLNFIPARLSIPIIFISSMLLRILFCPIRPINCLKICLRDMRKHASPNAGIPEAAFAGALAVRLGGLNYYSGERHCLPIMGEEGVPASICDISNALKLMWTSSLIFIAALFIFYKISKHGSILSLILAQVG
ncbi:MAG TPA: adenosylcobinamide-phosphate synthase CbiB [Victivallales bacterium]|nr:adenosylcobinamide-phosphate synthase CbiB [Victivallales bacterium]